MLPAGLLGLQLTAAGIVPRSVFVSTATSHELSISAIALGGAVDLDYYRALVRNNYGA